VPWEALLAAAASAVVVLGAIFGVVRYLIVHEIREVGAQLAPNGGSSFRDHVDSRFGALESRLTNQDYRLGVIDIRLNGVDSRLSTAATAATANAAAAVTAVGVAENAVTAAIAERAAHDRKPADVHITLENAK